MTAPRVIRAICGQPRTTITITTVQHAAVFPEDRQLRDHQRAKNQREGEKDVAETGDDGVNPAAVEAGQGTQGDADDQHTEHGKDAHRQRGLGAVDDARVHVAALEGEAERVARRPVRRWNSPAGSRCWAATWVNRPGKDAPRR